MYKINWTQYLSEKRLRLSEKGKNKDYFDKRNAFESDFGRVTFSPAMRRMHDKTQVIPLTSGDSVHTRLTHSIEVMNIAHSLGINYCRHKDFLGLYDKDAAVLENKICAILRSAAFIHDIGNPPFGHFGEVVIQQYFSELFKNENEHNFTLTEQQRNDFTQFDGNAQGFRNVTKLNYRGDLFGLNLTCATLGAYLKYPNVNSKEKENYIGLKKHGVFTSEKKALQTISKNCNMIINEKKKLYKRHPLSFLVEAADSICYLVMDIEDALLLKWITLQELVNRLKETESDIAKKIASISASDKNENDKFIEVRVALIDYFVQLATGKFIENLEKIDKGEYNYELIEDDKEGVANTLKDFTSAKILCRKEVESVELTGHSVICGLLEILISHIYNKDSDYSRRIKSVLSKSAIKVAFHEDKFHEEKYKNFDTDFMTKHKLGDLSDYAKLRLIVDYISNMTDKYAVKIFQQLSGQRL